MKRFSAPNVSWLLRPLLLACALAAPAAEAQLRAEPVPYVPTITPVVAAMLAVSGTDGGDVLYDLGSGDGRILITAAERFGARGVGFEIDPGLVQLSRQHAVAAGVDSLVRFVNDDLLTADLGPATVVALYLSPALNLELRPRLLEQLRPGARVVSHAFDMGDWSPDTVAQVGEGYGQATVYGWVVPADVDGFWQLVVQTEQGESWHVLELDQRFQRLGGWARRDGVDLPLVVGEIEGLALRFTLGPGPDRPARRFTGELADGEIRGTYTSSGRPGRYTWRAVRFTP